MHSRLTRPTGEPATHVPQLSLRSAIAHYPGHSTQQRASAYVYDGEGRPTVNGFPQKFFHKPGGD